MQVHIFAMGVQGIGPDHPPFYTVNVRALREPLLSKTMAALDAGTLSCDTNFGRELWVPYPQLAAVIGFGHNLHDPTDPYFVPPEAILKIPYLAEPVTDASPIYQQKFLRQAQDAADYLRLLHGNMPPRPYNLHVHRTQEGSPIHALIGTGDLRTHPSDLGWWVIAEEARTFLPAGERFDDPASAWFVDPHDWADQDEVDRFVAEHRRHWPEIYDVVGA